MEYEVIAQAAEPMQGNRKEIIGRSIVGIKVGKEPALPNERLNYLPVIPKAFKFVESCLSE
jgi:hypothetical protein